MFEGSHIRKKNDEITKILNKIRTFWNKIGQNPTKRELFFRIAVSNEK